MKQLNVAFDRLRGVMPDVKTITKEEKDTKVTTLRAAISYISGLQSLLADCEAGLVDPEQFKDDDEEELKMETTRRVVTKAKKKANKQAGAVKGVKMGATCADLGSQAPGCDVRGGGGGGDVKEGSRGIPVTLSMKTETVFTKLLGDGPPRPNNPGRAVELNLLSLQPVPINLLPSSFSPSPTSNQQSNSTLLHLPPSPPASLPSPSLHIGRNSNLGKQEAAECVGREGSASSYSLPPSPSDQDKMEEEEEMMTSMEEKMEMLSSLVPVLEEGEEEDNEDMVPSVEQLFQRSFSYELRDLWGGGGELVVLEGLLDGDAKGDLLVLEDIVSVIGGDVAATKVVA